MQSFRFIIVVLVLCTCGKLVHLCKCRRFPRRIEGELQDPCRIEGYVNDAPPEKLGDGLVQTQSVENVLQSMTKRLDTILDSYKSRNITPTKKRIRRGSRHVFKCSKRPRDIPKCIYSALSIYYLSMASMEMQEIKIRRKIKHNLAPELKEFKKDIMNGLCLLSKNIKRRQSKNHFCMSTWNRKKLAEYQASSLRTLNNFKTDLRKIRKVWK